MLALKNKKTSGRPEVRSLKIQPIIRLNRRSQIIVPEIKLSGTWLSELGFTPNQRVNVTVLNNTLVIDLEK